MKTLIQVDVNIELPKNPGKYIVDTKTRYSTNSFLAHFNGKSFDVNNQIVTHWYKEDKYERIQI